MKKKYRHLFFDLDHTLWDFDKNTSEAISEIYQSFNFSKWSFSVDDFKKNFHEANDYLWDNFNHGLIDRLELRNKRFKIILGKLGMHEKDIPSEIGDEYLKLAPSKPNVMPFAHEVLKYLSPKYQLHIISNGFDDVQHRKLKSAKIHHYFDQIVTSDNSGHRKPQREIFEFALRRAGATRDDSIFIGDNLKTDIAGAQNAQIDHIFFNPGGLNHSFTVTYEIKSLHQIMNIL